MKENTTNVSWPKRRDGHLLLPLISQWQGLSPLEVRMGNNKLQIAVMTQLYPREEGEGGF